MVVMQAWYAAHPPKRGRAFTTRPYVHQGFLKTWLCNGLNERVVSRVRDIVNALRDEGRTVHLYVTGARLEPLLPLSQRLPTLIRGVAT